MRTWLSRIRTALAVLAALLLILKIPIAYQLITTPDITLHKSTKSTTVLRVWYCESWTGSGMQWLTKQIAAFEKANPEIRVTVRRAAPNEWQTEGIVLPDILLFEAGAMSNPEEWLTYLRGEYPFKEIFQFSGTRHGLLYAAPICYGGKVRLINENKQDGTELIMQTDQQYADFISEKAGALIATLREARKLSALLEAGKGFPFLAEPYGEKTDMVLFASIFGNSGNRTEKALTLIDFLLSEPAQNSLQDVGLLATRDTANPPDEKKYPLLFSLSVQINDAVNAFD